MQQYLQNLVTLVFREARWLTRGWLLRCGSLLTFLAIGVLVLVLAFHNMPQLTDADGGHFGMDFVQFWTSAQLAAAGKPAAAYVLGAPDHITKQAISYPPIIMLLCRPLAGLSYAHAVFVWGGLGLALFAWTLSRLVGSEMAVFAAIGTPAGLFNISVQQNGYYTAALLASGLMLVERRPAFAGVLLGMLCYKPQFGILLLPALLAGRHWRVLAAAAVTALLLTGTTTILFGFDTWTAFFARTLVQRHYMETSAEVWSCMPTVFAMVKLFGASSPAAYAMQSLSAICAAIAVVALWRQRCPLGVKSAGLGVAAFLATPYAWGYDAVILVFAAAFLANEGVRTGFRSWEKMTELVLLTFPALSLISAKLLDLQLAPILLWLALAVVMRRALGQRFRVAMAPVGAPSPQSTV